MKRVVWSLAIAGMATCVLGVGDASAQAPPGVRISKVTNTGNGCKPGTTVVSLSEDGLAFTIIFSAFVAEYGPTVPNSAAQSKCKTHIKLDAPNGFTWSVKAVDHRGFANIADGAKGLQQATYHFRGAPQPTPWRVFEGPFFDDWHVRDEVSLAGREWAPCNGGGQLQINTEMKVERGTAGPDSESVMAADSEDLEIEQRYHIDWKRCN